MIIGLAECDMASETLLCAPGEEGHPSAPPQSLQARDVYEDMTLWGCEDIIVLVGSRKQMGSALDLLVWERRHTERYRRRRRRVQPLPDRQGAAGPECWVVGQHPHCDGPAPPQPPRQQQVAEQTLGCLAVVAG